MWAYGKTRKNTEKHEKTRKDTEKHGKTRKNTENTKKHRKTRKNTETRRRKIYTLQSHVFIVGNLILGAFASRASDLRNV